MIKFFKTTFNATKKIIPFIKEILTINSRVKKLEENALRQYCPNCRQDTLSYKTERCCEVDYNSRFEHTEKIIESCPCGYSRTISSQRVVSDKPVTENPIKSSSVTRIK